MERDFYLEYTKARSQGKELTALTDNTTRMERAKWLESGPNHSRWARYWAMYRLRHIQNVDERFPQVVENHVFSLIEHGRPIFSDNVPDIEWVAMHPSVEQYTPIITATWSHIEESAQWEAFWASLYDYYPIVGTVGAKAAWDFTAPRGGKAIVNSLDPKAVLFDARCTVNHRNARVIQIKHTVDLGELKSMFPSLAAKISAITQKPSGSNNDAAYGYDTGRASAYSSGVDMQTAELIETWIRPNVDMNVYSQTDINRPDSNSESTEEEWLVVSWIPGAGVVSEEIAANGLQIASGQCWRNAESVYGIGSVEMIAGLCIADDQLNIRGHQHRLANVAPPLLTSRNNGMDEFIGGPNRVWKFDDKSFFDSLQYLEVPPQSADVLKFLAENPEKMRKILNIGIIDAEILQRTQTATAVQAVRESVENSPRQQIRNLAPLSSDLARTLMSLTLTNSPQSIYARQGEGFMEISPEMMKDASQILRLFTARTSAAKSGPLTNQGRLASIQRYIEIKGALMQIGAPPELDSDAIDLLEVPHGEAIKAANKAALEAQAVAAEQAAAAQQAQQPQQPPPPAHAMTEDQMRQFLA